MTWMSVFTGRRPDSIRGDASPATPHTNAPSHLVPKIVELEEACSSEDLERLRKLAISQGGLVEDRVRHTAWPLLLGCQDTEDSYQEDIQHLPPHNDEAQVQLDVDRSFVYYPEDESDEKRGTRQQELSHLILTVLRRYPMLHYFQGYHDIVQVLLLVLGSNTAVNAAARLSLLRIRDFMLPTMSGTEPHLRLLPSILHAADPTLASHLSGTQPFFALPATLTLYAHVIEEYGEISRLFDFLLATEAVMSIYLFAVVVISRKDELLDIEPDEPEMLHSILSKLPKPLDLDDLIQRTVDLFHRHPPEKLPGNAWWHVSSSSVLKTTREWSKVTEQSTSDGMRWFQREAAEIRRREALVQTQKRIRVLAHQYRRPMAWTGTAVLFALFAFNLQGELSLSSVAAWGSLFDGVRQRLLELCRRLEF